MKRRVSWKQHGALWETEMVGVSGLQGKRWAVLGSWSENFRRPFLPGLSPAGGGIQGGV